MQIKHISYTAIRLLYVYHRTNSGGYVNNLRIDWRMSGINMPSIKQQWYVRIVWIPYTMGSALFERLGVKGIISWLQNNHHITASLMVISHNNTVVYCFG